MDKCEICGEHERSVREMLEAYPRTTLASFSSSFPFHVFLPLLSPILRLSRRLHTLTYGLLLKDVKCFKFPLTKTTEKIHQVVSFICDRCPLLLWQQCVYFWLADSFSKELQDLERLRFKRTEGATCYYLIYLMNNKCAWSDLTHRRKRPGSEGELFSFSFFLYLPKTAVYRRTNH